MVKQFAGNSRLDGSGDNKGNALKSFAVLTTGREWSCFLFKQKGRT